MLWSKYLHTIYFTNTQSFVISVLNPLKRLLYLVPLRVIFNVDPLSIGECVAGALWWKDLVSLAKEIGFAQPRLVTANKFQFGSKELEEAVGKLEVCVCILRGEVPSYVIKVGIRE